MTGEYAQNVVESDIQEGNRLKIKSTPTFYINGYLFPGIPTKSDIKSFY